MSILDIKFVSAPSKRLKKALSSSSDRLVLNNIRNWENESGEADDLIPDNFGDTHYVVLRDKNNTRLEIIEIDPSTIASSEITIRKRGLKFDGILTEDAALKQSWEVSGTIVELGTHTPQALESLLRLTKQNDFTLIPRLFESDGTTPAVPTEDAQAVNKLYVDTKNAATAALIGAKLSLSGGTMSGDVDMDGNAINNLPTPTNPNDAATKAFSESLANQGAANISETNKGIGRYATDAEFFAGNDGTGTEPTIPKPSQVLKGGVIWNSGRSYTKNDPAWHEGALYKALSGTTNVLPTFKKYKKDLNSLTSAGYVVTEAEAGNAGDIRSSCFSSDGLYFYTLSTSVGRVSRFKLTTAYDVSTKGASDQTVDLSSVDSQMWGIAINSDGTRLYMVGAQNDSVYQFNLGTAYTITGITTESGSYVFPYYSPNPYDLFLTPDDMSLFVCDYSSHDITRLEFGTAGDINTLSFDGQRFYTGNIEATEYGLAMSADGTKLFFGGANGDNIYQCTLTTAYDLSTMTYDNIAFDISGQATSMYDLNFSVDGTKMYVLNSNRIAYQYTLSTAWNVATASYDSVQLDMTSQDTGARSMAFSSNGLRMYMVGTTNDTVYQYNLSTAWAMNTATYSGNSMSVSAQETNPYAIAISDDGLSFFVGGNLKNIFKYTLSTANDISTGSFTNSSGVISGINNLIAMDVVDSGNKIMLLDQSSNNIYQINLTTAHDPSVFTTNWGGFYIRNNPEDIHFSGDGKTLYLSYNGGSRKYELGTAYDLDSIIERYYTRTTTSDPWVETTTSPSLQSNTNFTERGFYFEAPFDNLSIKKVKFDITRTSGSSGGTNQGTVTCRLYEVDDMTLIPTTTISGTATSVLTNLYNANPARDYELTFDTELVLGTDKLFFMTIEWTTDDTDTMVFNNLKPVAFLDDIEIEVEQFIRSSSFGNVNIQCVSPEFKYVYAANTSGIIKYESEQFPDIYWVSANPEPGDIIAYYQNTAFTTWTSPVDGHLNVSFFGSSVLSHNGVQVARSDTSSSNTWNGSYSAPVKKGDIITHSSNTNSYLSVRVNA